MCAELVTALPERRSAASTSTPSSRAPSAPRAARRAVTTEDVAIVVFRTVSGVTGSVVISQVSSGRKNQLGFEIAGAEATLAFDQEKPETLWVGRRGGTEIVNRDPAYLHPTAAAYCTVPPGHPQGYQDCFDAFVADTYRAIAAGSADAIDGLPTLRRRRPGRADHRGRAALRPQPPLGRRRSRTERDEGGHGMKLGFLTACLPGRSLASICEWAAAEGFEALEVAAWPDLGDRPFTATHLDRRRLRRRRRRRPPPCSTRTGCDLSSLAYYDNNLHPDPAERDAIHAAPAPLHRRGRAARAVHGRAPSSGETRGARWPRTSARPRRSSRRWSTTPARPA